MDLTRIDSIVQFTPGSETVWNNINVPVPAGVVVIDTVNNIIKEGDGSTLFANLPVCLDYDFGGGVSGYITPNGDQIGNIAISDSSEYKPSNVKLVDILSSITAANTRSATQQTRIDGLNSANRVVSVTPGTPNGTIVLCNGGNYGPGDKTLSQLISDLVAASQIVGVNMHIGDLEWYYDSALTNKITTQNDIVENTTYWCKITGFHDTSELRAVDFGLSTQTAGVTVTNTMGVDTCSILHYTYGKTSTYTYFYDVAVDSRGNIICVGTTNSAPSYYPSMLLVLDSAFNIIAQNTYGGSDQSRWFGVAVDHNDNIFVCGFTQTGVTYGPDLVVVKFDSQTFAPVILKGYGGAGNTTDEFLDIAIDSNNNVICVGYSASEGAANAAIVYKFDNSLNILYRKYYDGTGGDYFNCVAIDPQDNIICGGSSTSDGISGGSTKAIVVKFDPTLVILYRKRYGSTTTVNEEIKSIVIDSKGNIICLGTYTAATGVSYIYVVRFDSTLTFKDGRSYQVILNTSVDHMYNAVIDSNDNIICLGSTKNDTSDTLDKIFVFVIDQNLNVTSQKELSTNRIPGGITLDKNGNILLNGYYPASPTSLGLLVQLPPEFPTGTIVSAIGNWIDIDIVVSTVTPTIANSVLTLSTDALTARVPSFSYDTSPLRRTGSLSTVVAARNSTPVKLLTTIYSSTGIDTFASTVIASSGNIIAVGSTAIAGTVTALIVVFNSTFTPLVRKTFTGKFSQQFSSAVIDSTGNIICVGSFVATEGNPASAFVAKLDSNVSSVLYQKVYDSAGIDEFYGVAIDPAGDIIAIGYTTSEGSGLSDGLIVKFSRTDFSILAKKVYGGSGNDVLTAIVIDSVGNTICVGYTGSEGVNKSGLILKLNSTLDIVLRKYYNSPLGTGTEFLSVAITSANNVYCVGRVIIAAGDKGLVVKFDSSLVVTGKIVYGNTMGSTQLTGVALDSSGHIMCVGKTNAEGAGNYDALILRLSKNLTIAGRKTYGSIDMDADVSCAVTSLDDIIVSGYTVLNGSTDAIITKMPSSLPAGCYTNKYFNELVLADSNLILSNDTGSANNSTSTLTDSNLNLTSGNMTIGNASGGVMTDTTIMDATSNVFKVALGDVISGSASVASQFTITADDGNVVTNKNVSVNIHNIGITEVLYGGAGADCFNDIAIDLNGNIYAVGYTSSEGSGGYDGLIVKFDSDLNILIRKVCGTTAYDQFNALVISKTGAYIYVVGYTKYTDTNASNDAIVIKFDSSLAILVKIYYGVQTSSAMHDTFNDVALDSQGNVYCVGSSYSATTNYDGLIVKYDSNLTWVRTVVYGKAATNKVDEFYGIAIDSTDNIFVVGADSSDATSTKMALIMMLETSALSVLYAKYYGSTVGDDYFNNVAVAPNGNIVAVGYTASEGQGGGDALIVVFNSTLTIVTKKIYGGGGADVFTNLAIDSDNKIYCVGYTGSIGFHDGMLVVFDAPATLNVTSAKRCGISSITDHFNAIALTTNKNLIIGGYMNGGSSTEDGFMMRAPVTMASGTFVGTTITNLFIYDLALTLATATKALTNSTLAAQTLQTFAAGTYNAVLANSTLTLTRDTSIVP